MLDHFLPFLIFTIASWVMLIAFLVFWIKNRGEARPYLRTGLILVALYFALEAIVFHSFGVEYFPVSMPVMVVTFLITAVRICLFAVVGLLIADRLNDAFAEAEPSGAGQGYLARYGLSVPTREAVVFALAAVLFMLAYTAILFRLTEVTMASAAQRQAENNFHITFSVLLAVASAGFIEEILYRLGLQNALTFLWRASRYGHHLAIVVTSALWSWGHFGALEPGWVKTAQIFVFGIILGHMNRRYGVVPCIIMHSLFNVTVAVLPAQILGIAVLPG